MLTVYYVLTATNIFIGILIGIFLILPITKSSSTFKIIHLFIISLSTAEIIYFIHSSQINQQSILEQTFLLSIIIQIVWSCVLLYISFQFECNINKNLLLQQELEKHQQLYEEIKSLALSDALTNIANRRNFDMFLKTELHRAASLVQPVSLIILDLDKFKIYNDTFGHLSGDKLLAQIGQILIHHITPKALPARYGGEEFSIILPETNIENAVKIAESLRNTIENSNFPDHSGSFTAKITASFGVATYDPEILFKQPDAEKIISIADKALYKAKQQGRNRVFGSVIFQ